MTKFWALVLAGGRSSRMGQDKALIATGQETLLLRTCRVASESCERVAVITSNPEQYQVHLPDWVEIILETPLPVQAESYQGPLVGMLQAMKALARQAPLTTVETNSRRWLLVLACDLPNLSAPILEDWQQLVKGQPQHVGACLPQRQGRWEPLCGFYRFTYQDSIQRYIDQGGRSFQGWLNRQSVTRLPLADEKMLFNLNTPEDLQQWQSQA